MREKSGNRVRFSHRRRSCSARSSGRPRLLPGNVHCPGNDDIVGRHPSGFAAQRSRERPGQWRLRTAERNLCIVQPMVPRELGRHACGPADTDHRGYRHPLGFRDRRRGREVSDRAQPQAWLPHSDASQSQQYAFLSLTTTFGGKLTEKSCEADYGDLGSYSVNCRLAASQMAPEETLKYLVNAKPESQHLWLNYRVTF